MERKYILTIAVGKDLYIDMAANLARSFFWWHPNSDIIFRIVTDNENRLPDDVKQRAEIMHIHPGEFGEGFSPKLHLDQLAAEGQTLFIDSDCLVFGNLDWVFERFKGHSVSVVGGYISKGEWFGDIEHVCREFSVPHVPKFNGGIYYLENGETAAAVYKTARELEKRYDEIGLVRLRNRPNDELLMALAMQLHGQQPIADDGTIMSDPQACPGGYKIDVITGERWLINPKPPHPKHQSWYPFYKVSPVIFHFLGYYTQHHPYRLNAFLLEKATEGKLNPWHRVYASLTIAYPWQLKQLFKTTMRPLYHSLFGTRPVKSSVR